MRRNGLIQRIASKIILRKANRADGGYSAVTSVKKGALPALLAIFLPTILQALAARGVVISEGDALQLVLAALAVGASGWNWVKNYLAPKLK